MKKKCILISILIVAGVVLVVLVAGGWSMFGTQLTAALSIQKLDDGLWCMEYTGEYGCSTLAAKSSDGRAIFGRNFDWEPSKTMLIHTVPKNGYESISTCCLNFLGFGEDWTPDGGMGDKFMALAAVYVPLDGMNEKGLCVADLIVKDGEIIHQDTEKPDLTITSAIRLLLDKAATVDEAVELLEQYDINFSIDSSHHFSIADATGRSVVEELKHHDFIVLAYPVQFSNAPIMVRDFIRHYSELWKGKKVLCVATMGLFSGDGAGCSARLLKKYGAKVIGGLHIHMPDSVCDVKLLKKPVEQNKKIVKAADIA